jgi:hypothetical protein
MKTLLLPAALLFGMAVSAQDTKTNGTRSGLNQAQKEFKIDSNNALSIEEIEALYPEAISYDKKNVLYGKNTYRTVVVKTINTEKLVVLLATSLKEQQAEMAHVKEQLKTIKSKSAGK